MSSTLRSRLLSAASSGALAERMVKILRSGPVPSGAIHANGFLKAEVPDVFGGTLRVHLWDPADRRCDVTRSDIHNHRWDFASMIVTGEVRSRLFRPTSGYGMWGEYECFHDESAYQFRPLGKASMLVTSDRTLVRGVTYYLDSLAVHDVVPSSSEATVTIVLHGPRKSLTSRVFLPLEEPGSVAVSNRRPNVPLDAVGARAVLEQALAGLRDGV